jgi:hypothetical protein
MPTKEMIGLISFIDNYGPQLTNSIVACEGADYYPVPTLPHGLEE